ncbi:MAG: sarcosine oxidase subunit gamma [Geminicoccaceae bacterium]
MPSLQLKAEPLLGGFCSTSDGTDLTELTKLAIVSIAIPMGGDAAVASAVSKAFGADMPNPGGSTLSSDGQTRFIWTAPDQLFALFEDEGPDAAADMRERLDGTAYVTLQSDSWVALRLSGCKAQEALERICPIDLHQSAFPTGRVSRTAMEHMGAIVIGEGGNSFLLLSASSSAKSYLHAVKTSLQNVS